MTEIVEIQYDLVVLVSRSALCTGAPVSARLWFRLHLQLPRSRAVHALNLGVVPVPMHAAHESTNGQRLQQGASNGGKSIVEHQQHIEQVRRTTCLAASLQ